MMSHYDMWRTCRTCLFKAEELVSLDGASDISIHSDAEWISSKTNGDLLMELANVQVHIDDGLPRNVCVECAASLRAAFAYKQMCEESDAKLRRIFVQHLNSVRVKLERIETNIDYGHEPAPSPEALLPDNRASEIPDECSIKSGSEMGGDWAMPIQNSDTDDAMDETTAIPVRKMGSNGPVERKVDPTDDSDDGEMESATHEESRLKCDVCKLKFSNIRTFKNHMNHHNDFDRNAQPPDASAIENGPESAAKSEAKSVKPVGEDEQSKIAERAQCVDGRFICEFCNNSYADRSSLKVHIGVHLNSNLVHCTFCDRSFSRQSYLKTHIETQHAKNFPCEKCVRVLDSKRALRTHMYYAHRPPRPAKEYTCEICSRVFNRINNLNQHRLTHSGEKNFSCDICQRKVTTKQVLRDHMRIHGDKSNYYRFLCPHCGQKFTTTTHMHGHIRTKHTGDKPYKCDTCEETFFRYDLLAQHKLKHKPRFVCTVCGKSLSSNERLKTHSRIHTGEKPFSCDVCHQAFAQKKTLRNHLRGHHGDVPHKCNVCSEVFTNPRWLELHRRQCDHLE